MRFLSAVSLSALLAGWTAARNTHSFGDLVSRQTSSQSTQQSVTSSSNAAPASAGPATTVTDSSSQNVTAQCLDICEQYQVLSDDCTYPHCGCNVTFIAAQGYCGVCQAQTPIDAATVQLLLDAEMAQCRTEGININFKLTLPPEAQAIVDQVDKQSAELRRQQTAYLALQIAGGHVGLPIVLVFAVFSRKVRRDPTFLNFCITWIFSSVVFSLELYRGTTDNTIVNSLGEVPPNKCLAQSALTEGAQVMTACSTLALVIRLWMGLRAAIYGDFDNTKQNRTITMALLLVPYLFFIVFGLSTVFVGMHHFTIEGTQLQRAIPTNFYCTVVEPDPFIRAVYGVTLALLIVTMGFDVYIVTILYKHWLAFRHVQTKSAVSLSLLLRVMTFSLYRIVVAVAYGTVLNVVPQVTAQGEGDSIAIIFSLPVWIDMLQAAIPLVGTFVLGISNDMITTVAFWRRNKEGTSLDSANSAGIGPFEAFDEKNTFDNDPHLKAIRIDV